MTSQPALRVIEKHALLALALGREVPQLARDSWHAVLAAADRNRLVAVIWARSGAALRSTAPPDLVERWRLRALHISTSSARHIRLFRTAWRSLESHHVSAIVLKGPPLARRLYGDETLRPMADFDLYVPANERADARAALSVAGWRSVSGEPPHEEMFDRVAGGMNTLIELHSAPLDDPLLSHVRFPVELEQVSLGGFSVAAHGGDYLPAYLAAHMAKHDSIPLLWVADLHALWTTLSDDERGAALAAAKRAGLDRHVSWALAVTEAADRGAAGDAAAIDRLDQHLGPIADLARLRRLIRLSPDARHAVRVVAGRLWPPEWRGGLRALPRKLRRRVAGAVYRALEFDRPASSRAVQQVDRVIDLEQADAADLLRHAVEIGDAFWVRSRGSGMHPALPASALARILPVHIRRPRREDIVLARLSHAELALQRVVAITPGALRVRADAIERETMVPSTAILGTCDAVAVGGRIWSPRERPRSALGLLLVAWRTRLGRFGAAERATARQRASPPR